MTTTTPRIFGLALERNGVTHAGFQGGGTPYYSIRCRGVLRPGPAVFVGEYGAEVTCPECIGRARILVTPDAVAEFVAELDKRDGPTLTLDAYVELDVSGYGLGVLDGLAVLVAIDEWPAYPLDDNGPGEAPSLELDRDWLRSVPCFLAAAEAAIK